MVHFHNNKLEDVVKLLNPLRDDKELGLASRICLSSAYKCCPTPDRSKADEIDVEIKEMRRTANGMALFHAASVLFGLHKFDKAKEFAEKAMKHKIPAQYLVGFASCYCLSKEIQRTAEYYFGNEDENVTAEKLLGLAICAEVNNDFSEALRLINQTIIQFPIFLPALMEKIDILLLNDQWDQAIEASSRCLGYNSHCVISSTFKVLHSLCRGSNYAQAFIDVDKLSNLLSSTEPNNSFHYTHAGNIIFKFSGRHPQLLSRANHFINRALEIGSVSSSTQLVAASINLANGRTKEALVHFRKALSIDESSTDSMNGLIRCHLLLGDIKDASLQLELLDELHPTIGQSSETIYLQGLLLQEQKKKYGEIMDQLDKSMDVHFRSLKNLPHSIDYYVRLNPDFLLQIVNTYLSLSKQTLYTVPNHKISVNEVNAILSLWPDEQRLLNKSEKLLSRVLEAAPSLLKANYILACIHFRRGNFQNALKYSQIAIDIDPNYIDAHALLATIYLALGNLRMAEQTLEVGLSNNFDLRSHPLNSLVRAKVFLSVGEDKRAIQVLSETLANPDAPGRSKKPPSSIEYSEFWITAYTELIYTYQKQGEVSEARRILADAKQIYSNTFEMDRLAIVAADLDIAEGNLESALAQLRSVASDRPGYILAKQHMADIYLNHRKEWKLYIACYRELAETLEMCSFVHLLLGDAYLRVEKPDQAIKVYESVLRWEPSNLLLASKMGEALVMTHEFERAVLYYESALTQVSCVGRSPLLPDFTVLLIRLKQLEKTEVLLKSGLESIKNSTEISDLQRYTDLLLLLATVHRFQEDYIKQFDCYTKVSKTINEIQKHINTDDASGLFKACKKLQISIQIHTLGCLLHLHKGSKKAKEQEVPLEGDVEDDLLMTGDFAKPARFGGPSKELEKAMSICDEALHSFEAMQTHDIDDRLKQAAVLSLQARCHIINRERAQCEQTCLKLAVCQEEIQAIDESITFEDFDAHVELFSPLAAERNALGVLGLSTFPVTKCATVVRFVPAAIIMANLLTQECDFAGVLPHLLKHLSDIPDDYIALTHLINTYSRLGQLSRAEKYLNEFLQNHPSAKSDSGFHFAQGFYHWHRGDTNLAIRSFNIARLSRDYEAHALSAMIENYLSLPLKSVSPSSTRFSSNTIFLNTDLRSSCQPPSGSLGINDEVSAAGYSDAIAEGGQSKEDVEIGDVESASYETAALLLVKLRSCQTQSSMMHRFLQNLHLALSRDKTKIEQAIQNFAEMNEECESVPAIYGAAVCYVLLHQEQKAKNQLKRLAKCAWTPEESSFLERAWLLLADIYLYLDKRDIALDLLKRCLQYNQSCYRAHEFMGTIAEKSGSYEDAVKQYSTAWEILNKQDLSVGFKLALACLRSKDYFRTAETCHDVLTIAPNYSYVQTNILRKALDAMRT